MKVFFLIFTFAVFAGFLNAKTNLISHPPSSLDIRPVHNGAKLTWDYETPDTVISHNAGVPFGIWGPKVKHALGVIFDLNNFPGASLEEISFAHFSRNMMEGPYLYNIHIFDMDSLKTIKIIDSLSAADADTMPSIEIAVELGSIPASGLVGIFIEGLSSPDGSNSFPALMTDSTELVPNTSFYCLDVDDPFLLSDPDYTNIYELRSIDPGSTNFILDLWINVNGEQQKIPPTSENDKNIALNTGTAEPGLVDPYIGKIPLNESISLNKTMESAAGFNIYRGNSIDDLEIVENTADGVRDFTDENISENTTYYYGVARFTGSSLSELKTVEYFHPQEISIASAREDNNEDFIPDRLDEQVYVSGIVSTPNFSSKTSYFIQDGRAGINIYSPDFTLDLNIGDSVFVGGRLTQFNGLTEIRPEDASDLTIINSGNTIDTLEIKIADVSEKYEGMLVSIENVTLINPEAWPSEGNNGTDIQVVHGTSELDLYIDKDTNLDGWTPPTGNLRIVGVIDQYTSKSPANDGYELRPRYISDFTLLVGIENISDNLPQEFKLQQNYPNPFNPQTTIVYELPKASDIEVRVYNTLGQEIVKLVQTRQSAGKYKLLFDGHQLATGIYYYHLKTDGFEQVRKMVLVK